MYLAAAPRRRGWKAAGREVLAAFFVVRPGLRLGGGVITLRHADGARAPRVAGPAQRFVRAVKITIYGLSPSSLKEFT